MKIILYKCVALVLLIFTSDTYFLYVSNEGCFTFLIHHFNHLGVKVSYIKDKMQK